MIQQRDLPSICSQIYFPLNLKITSPKTVAQYRFALNDFAETLGRDGTIDDLTDDNLTRMTRHLTVVRGLSPRTVNERVGRLKSLWTWLGKRGEMRTFPTTPRIDAPEPVPFAWSVEELRRLFDAAGNMPGWVGGVRAGDWWQALLAWLWCTGERKDATLKLEYRHLNFARKIATVPASVRKRKKKTAVYPLWSDVIERMKAVRQGERVFHWPFCDSYYFKQWDKLNAIAGLPTGRECKTQCIRVSFATWITVSGGDATKALLHDSPVTTKRHYIDSRHLPHDVPDLPRLG